MGVSKGKALSQRVLGSWWQQKYTQDSDTMKGIEEATGKKAQPGLLWLTEK